MINSLDDDYLSDISKDGLSLYFASSRPGLGDDDIWVSKRTSVSAPWDAPMNLGIAINTSYAERTPSLSRDGHFLFFVTDRPGGLGGLDVWVSWRRHTDNDFGWGPPEHLGPMNSPFNDAGPAYFEDKDAGTVSLYFASNRPGGIGAFDIYVSHLTAAGSFGPAVLVPELSSPLVELRPAIRNDGLEIFLTSNRIGTIGGAGSVGLDEANSSGQLVNTCKPWPSDQHSFRGLVSIAVVQR